MISNVDPRRVVGCIKVSARWHTILRIGQDNQLAITESDPHPLNQPTDTRVATTTNGPLSLSEISQISSLLSDQLDVKVRAQIKDNMAQLAALYFPPPQAQSPSSLRQVSRYVVHPSRLRDLRNFLGDPTASFKFPEQAQLVEMMQARQSNILAIFPCNGGKTFMILFQASQTCTL
jgi:hypothetical protein